MKSSADLHRSRAAPLPGAAGVRPDAGPPGLAPFLARLARLSVRLPRAWGGEERHLPWLVLILGLLFTALVFEQNRRLGSQAHERIERALMDDVADAIETKLQQAIETVNGVAGLFNASPAVSREDFRRYVDTIRRDDQTLNGIQGIGFSRFLTPADRPAQEAAVRAEGFDGFRIRPAGDRRFLSTILFLEPFNLRNQRAFGFDMFSEPVRHAAMQKAALSGMAVMSGKVKLLQETSSGIQAGVLIYVPIYGRRVLTVPTNEQDFPARLVGWAYAPLRVGDLVNAALRTVNNPDLQGSAVLLYDGGEPGDRALMFDNKKLHGTPQLSDPQFQTISVAGHSWLIGIQLSRSQIGPSGITGGLWMLALSGLMTASIAALITELLVANHGRTRAALRTAEKARNELALAAVVFEASPQAIVVSDPHGRVISANPSFARITGYSGSEILGRPLSLLKSGRHEPTFYRDLWEAVRERGFWHGEIWNRLRSGEVRRHELSITAVRNPRLEVIHYVGMLQDVSERHRDQEAIRHRALHDPLTGLANRALLLELTDRALAGAEREGQRVALLFLDLNGFKPINDRHGHALGDRVLQAVARRLHGVIRGTDTPARLGGDEFVVLVPRLGGPPGELQPLALRIRDAIAAVPSEFAVPFSLSASVGIAWSPDHGVTTGQLISAADAAMYCAKQRPDQPVQIARVAGAAPEAAVSPAGSPG